MVTAPRIPVPWASSIASISAIWDASDAKSMIKSGAAWSSILPRQRARASARTGQLIRVCAPRLSICVRMAAVPCEGRAQAELHPRGDVGRAPIRGAILDHGVQRIVEKPSGFASAARCGLCRDECERRRTTARLCGPRARAAATRRRRWFLPARFPLSDLRRPECPRSRTHQSRPARPRPEGWRRARAPRSARSAALWEPKLRAHR